MNKNTIAILFLLALVVLPFTSNMSLVGHVGTTYETVDVLRPQLLSNGAVTLASVGDDYVDTTYSSTYGTQTLGPPSGAGNADAASSDWLEASFVENQYTTKDGPHSMSTFPPTGWSTTGWSQIATGGNPTYYAEAGAGGADTLTSKAIDLTGYTGVRWTWDSKDFTAIDDFWEDGDFYIQTYTGSWVTQWSNTGHWETWTNTQDSQVTSYSAWQVRFVFVGTTDEYCGVDNILIEAYVAITGYRLEFVWQFSSVDYSHWVLEELYFDFDATTTTETIDVYGGTTTNPATLVADSKYTDFSVNIHSTLTGSTYYIKIVDELRTGDADADTWLIDKCYIKLTNSDPASDGAPTCSNKDDTDNLYSRAREYNISIGVSDADGYADFVKIFYGITTDGGVSYPWFVIYYEDTNTFGESDINGYIELGSSSSAVRSGNKINLTIYVTYTFIAPDVPDDDCMLYLVDYYYDSIASEIEVHYDTDWDWETDLEYDTTPTVTSDDAGTVDRGDWNENFHFTGDISYDEPTGDPAYTTSPPSAGVDFWVSSTGYGTPVGPWETDTLNADGTFTLEAYGDDATGSDTLTVKVVTEGGGSAGTDLVSGADPTDTYISDRTVESTSFQALDGNINKDASCLIFVQFKLEFDDHPFGTGDSVTLATYGVMTWDAVDVRFEYARSEAIVTMISFNIIAVSEATHGIAAFSDPANVEVIWNRILIITTVANDTRVNWGAYSQIRVTAYLEYTASGVHWLGSGDTLYCNDTVMSWDATNSWFELDVMFSEAELYKFWVNSTRASEATYGITVVNLDSKQVSVTWERLVITMTPDTTSPLGGQPVTMTVSVTYDSDDSVVSSWTMMVTRDSIDWQTKTSSPFQDTNAKGVHYVYSCSSAGDVGGYDITVFTVTPSSEVTWTNNAPVTSSPSLLNPDETDNMFPYYKIYTIQLTITDVDGYADIYYVTMKWYGDYPSYGWVTFKYIQDTDEFSTLSDNYWTGWGYQCVELQTSNTSGTSGNSLVMNFNFYLSWYFRYDDFDVYVVAYDDTTYDSDVYVVNWDTINTFYESTTVFAIVDREYNGDYSDPEEIMDAYGSVQWEGGYTGYFSGAYQYLKVEVYYGTYPTGLATCTMGSDRSYSGTLNARTGYQATTYYARLRACNSSMYWGSTNWALWVSDEPTDSHTTGYIEVDIWEVNYYLHNPGTQCIGSMWLEFNWVEDTYVTTGTFTACDISHDIYNAVTHVGFQGGWDFAAIRSYLHTGVYQELNGSDATYGISTIDMESRSFTHYWDGIDVVLTPSYQWTVHGYWCTIDATGTYNQKGGDWDGYLMELNNTYDGGGWDGVDLMFDTVGNYSFNATEIHWGSDNVITYIASTTYAYVVWDAPQTTSLAEYWVQYSVDKVWLIWQSGTWSWEVNDTTFDSEYKIQTYINTTVDDWCYILDNGQCNELVVGPFNTAWYWLNLTVMIEYTHPDTRFFNVTYESAVLEVEILHTINIVDSGIDVSDYWITFIVHTYWANASFTVWDNDTLVGHSGVEGWLPIERPTEIGLHNYTVLVNGTHGLWTTDGQTKSFEQSDSWTWLNYPFTIQADVAATGEMRFAMFDNANNWVPFETLNCTLTYNDNDYVLTSASATVPTSASFRFVVRDGWGVVLYNESFDYTQFKRVTLELYELVVDNQATHKVRMDVSYNGTYPNITIQLPPSYPRFLYLAPGNYTILFTYYVPVYEDNNIIDYGELSGFYVEYSYELIGNGYLEYTGIGLDDIKSNIDYTRMETLNSVDEVNTNVMNIPLPPGQKTNVLTINDFWLVVGAFAAVAILFAIGGHGIKGYTIAKKQKIFFKSGKMHEEQE